MKIKDFLTDLGLSRYIEILSEFPIEDLVEFTDDDFKELGVLTPHRKKLLEAIATLNNDTSSNDVSTTSIANKSSSSFSNFIKDLPQVIAIPLHEYAEEDHPGMKLWAACDAIELLLKFLVIIGAADRRQHGELDDKLLKELWGKIEMPTLGAWLSMAISLAQTKNKQPLMLPEIDKYVNETLKKLLYGPDNPGTADTSFLKLRNRLAHGGGLTRKEAERLIRIWQEPFEKTIESLNWLSDIGIVGLNDNVPMELKGTSDNLTAAPTLDVSQFKGDSDGVWLVRGKNTLSLWPMALFGYPSVSNSKGNIDTGDVNSTQIYVRKDVVQLQFTPLGAEGFSHSEAGVSAVEAFQSLFSLKRANQKASEKAFKIQDFGREIQKDANQMVGRLEEQEHIENSFKDIEQGIIWITGPAGIGKSFLVARLAQDLIDNNTDENKIILPYRFKSGDDARCNRDAFANFAVERLVAMGALIDNVKVDEKDKAKDRLKSCLDYLKKDKKVVFIIDGLDELLSRDATFAEEIPLGLDSMRITWVCSGRPEPELEKAFSNSRVINPYPNGLPAMQTQDIRSMLLERIGLFRNKLLAGDKEKGDETANPFIDLVAKRAEGLPLFVNYVTQDVQQGNYPLDGTANLPKGLTAYHEKLIEGLGVGALKELLTPLVATLAVANEPLAEQEIITFLRLRNRIPDGEPGDKLVTKGLSAIASMLRRAPDPEGEDGYMLHHLSLREHILSTETMSYPVEQSRKAYAKAAMNPDEEGSISNYLYRTGIDHLLSNNQVDDARAKLLDLDYLAKLFKLDKQNQDILQYWLKIEDDKQGEDYIASVNQYIKRDLKEEGLKVLIKCLNLFTISGWYMIGVQIGELVVRYSKNVLGSENTTTITIIHNLGLLFMHKGDYEQAEVMLRKSLAVRERDYGSDDYGTLKSLNVLGLILKKRGNYKESETLFRRSLQTREKLLGNDHPSTIIAMNNLGTLLKNMGDKDGAEIIMRRSLEICNRTLGNNHRSTFTVQNNLGLILTDKGEYEEAEPLYLKSLEGREKILGKEHPSTIIALNNLGLLFNKKGDYNNAEKLYNRALEASERQLGEFHPSTLTLINNLGDLFRKKDDLVSAESFFERAVKGRENVLGVDHPKTMVSISNLAYLLKKKHNYKEALKLYKRIVISREKSLGKKHNKTLKSKQSLAVTFRDFECFEDSIKLFKEVITIRRECNDLEGLSSSLTALGTTFANCGRYDEAILNFLESIKIRRQLIYNGYESLKDLLTSTFEKLAYVYDKTGENDKATIARAEADQLTKI